MGGPVRIQLSRRKGWRMPENTVSVARPGKWGNPFQLLSEEGFPLIIDRRSGAGVFKNVGGEIRDWSWDEAPQAVVDTFRQRAVDALPNLDAIRGKNLACWCPLDQPCHADVLLELANKEPHP